MKDKIRKCIGCQKNFERAQLFRILKDYQSGKIILNPTNKDFGRSVYLCKNSECIEKAFKKGNVVIESMYSWSEYKIVKEKFGDAFEVLCIATDAPLRRARLETRAFRPMDRASSQSRDYSEIENIEKGGPIGIADHYILNNGTISTFRRHVVKYINSL